MSLSIHDTNLRSKIICRSLFFFSIFPLALGVNCQMSEIIRSTRHAQTCSWLSSVSLLQLVEVVPRAVSQCSPSRPGLCKQDVSPGSLAGDDTELQPVEGGSSVSLLTILVLACHSLSCPMLCVDLCC